MRKKKLPGGCALWTGCCALLLTLLPARATTVMVHDVDVRGMAVGARVDVPVQIAGVTISSFGAFVLDFAYDRSGLRFDLVERGPLLAATGAASREQTPYLWALETSHDEAGGRLRVAGMILGENPEDNTAAGMAAARLTSPEGVLLTLRFTLLAVDAARVNLVTGTDDGRCALVDDGEEGQTAEEPSASSLIAGGALVDGMPNWWALAHFGDPEHDSEADDDGDWRENVLEYDEDTDPGVPDQRLTFQVGWNMLGFRAVPNVTPADWVAAVNAASAVRGARAGAVLSATVYYFDSARLRYVMPSTFEAGKAYWFYAHEAGSVQFAGVPAPADYSIGATNGWQMVALPEDRTKAQLAADVGSCRCWDAEHQECGPDTEIVQAVSGHWVYRQRTE